MAIVGEGGSRRLRAGQSGWNQSRRRARPVAEVLEARQLLATITVNSSGDADGADGSDTLSLRQAIEVSNGTLATSALTRAQAALVSGVPAVPNTIDFAIPGIGPFVIEPASALPLITASVLIDGYSEPGAHPNTNGPGQGNNAVIQIELDGANATAGADGLDILYSGTTVQGLAIGGFTSTGAAGIHLQGDIVSGPNQGALTGFGGDVVRGDFIGLDASGTVPLPNSVGILDNNRYQATYLDFSPIPIGGTNTIGGAGVGDGNVISGNLGEGLSISGGEPFTNASYPADELVQGNFIGLDATGTAALPNGGDGVLVVDSFPTIGGTAAADRNIISGNHSDGIDSTNGYGPVQGNFIGTDVTGTRPLGNGGNGIDASGQSSIGGAVAGAGNVISGNVISGNVGDGLFIVPLSSGTLVQGNFIGTDATGTRPLPNLSNGIEDNGSSATIGGTVAADRNVISGNGGDGLTIDGTNQSLLYNKYFDQLDFSHTPYTLAADNLVEGNFIGTDVTGTRPLGNLGDGVAVTGMSNTIGGTAAGAGNVIADNAGDGISVSVFFAGIYNPDYTGLPFLLYSGFYHDVGGGQFNAISVDSIFGNTGRGIHLLDNFDSFVKSAGLSLASEFASSAIKPGDPPGGNGLLAAPIIQVASSNASGTGVSGTLSGTPLTTFTVELFDDPNGSGQGKVYLGSALATTDATGLASFNFASPFPLAGQYLTASATDPMGDTSEFAQSLLVKNLTTTTTLAVSSPVATVGLPLVITATVTSPELFAGVPNIPTGQVVFTSDGVTLGIEPLDVHGVATLITGTLSPGAHAIQASYLGNEASSVSNAVAVTIVETLPPATTVTLIGPNRVATQGQPISFTVALSLSNDAVAPLGQVDFLVDGVVINSAPVSADGLVTFVTDQLQPGPHVIAADYLGDLTHPATLSNAVAVQVNNATAFGGPSVTSDVFAGPKAVTVTFNRGLLIGPAQDVSNYKIVGPHHQVITILSALYNPSNASVTLMTKQTLDPHKSYQLTINGQKGDRVVDVFGIALNGKKKGKPGHNYSGKVAVKKVPAAKVEHAKVSKPKVHATAHKTGH